MSFLSLARALPPPYTAQLWITEPGELELQAQERGLPCVRSEGGMLDWRRPAKLLARIARVTRALRRAQVDLVHVNSPMEAPAFIAAARLCRLPCVVHVRIACDRRFLRRQGLPLADAVVFNSASLRAQVGWAAATVILDGTDPPPALPPQRRLALRQELGVRDDELLLGQLGQVIPIKGIDLSLEAVATLRKRGRAVRLAVVGEDTQMHGEYAAILQRMALGLGIAAHVAFTGYRRDAAQLLGAFDLVLCPSRVEPFGRVLIEAMACGVPVIAARVGGIPEVIRDGVDGMLVAAEDAPALAAAIDVLLADPQRRRAMGEAGGRSARGEFASALYAQRMAALYDRVAAPYLSSPRPAQAGVAASREDLSHSPQP